MNEHGPDPLATPERVHALAAVGLSADSDTEMEFYAERVRTWLGVPVALVSLVRPDEQVFPGMAGLPEPWASKRATPLSHSFCRHVATSGEPLVVSHAAADPRVCDNLAIPDLGVAAYAGMPLTDAEGTVLGSLCAIDTEPREWSQAQLGLLQDLARACSAELRLRLSRHDADAERRRRDELDRVVRRSVERNQSLLHATQAFAETVTVDDVAARLVEALEAELRPSTVTLVSTEPGGRRRRLDLSAGPGGAVTTIDAELAAMLPSATAARENRLVYHPDRESFDAAHAEPARALFRALGAHSCVAAPLLGADGSLGALAMAWDTPRQLDVADLVSVTTITGLAAHALVRAQQLDHRTTVAQQLQQAMLTRLPEVAGLTMAARYLPADHREHVGGDWYDAVPLPELDDPGAARLAVSVGDIAGHEMRAAATMGQVRSMLRQAAWDHGGHSPSTILTAFERANRGVGPCALGTAVVAHLRRSPDGAWGMEWTNAGHPPPLLLHRDGTAEALPGHGPMFGVAALAGTLRTDHRHDLRRGDTLLLHTDGLVERPGLDIDEESARLLDLAAGLADRTPQEIVDTVVATLAADARDDVVAFAIRLED